eukprot:gene5782-7980_t
MTNIEANDQIITCIPDLAGMHNITYLDKTMLGNSNEFNLIIDKHEMDGCLELRWNTGNKKLKSNAFRIDFLDKTYQRRKLNARSELICKAIGFNNDFVLDFTAGLGRDSFIMASVGMNIIMFERNKILFLLLEDALHRLRSADPTVGNRMKLYYRDASKMNINDLSSLFESNNFSITNETKISVYLDPMYEVKHFERKSLVKKDTQILHKIVGSDVDDESYMKNNEDLVQNAIKISTNRVVVKRSLNAPTLTDSEELPRHSVVKGSTQRFDIYINI